LIVRCEAIFRGLVQGVHFRDYTKRFSRRCNVVGWVRNLTNGTVEAVFEGEREDIEEVVRLLREEHPRARVDSYDLRWLDAKNEFQKFEVF
jgi:acylphosphatase